MKFRKILFVLLILQVLFTLGMKFLSYFGDDSPELQTHILKYFTQSDIEKGIEYGRRGFFVRIFSQIIDFIILGLFVFTSLANRIENYLEKITNNRYYAVVVLFFLVFSLIEFILSIPFQFYFGYILEHQFGFSKMTFIEWVIYTAKSALVGVGFGIVIALAAAFTLKTFQKTWKYLLPIGSLSLSLIFSILYPILITPIFYDYKPIEEGTLKTKIVALCETAKIQVEDVYVIN